MGPVAWSQNGTRLAFATPSSRDDLVVVDVATSAAPAMSAAAATRRGRPTGRSSRSPTTTASGSSTRTAAPGSSSGAQLSTADRLDPPAWWPDDFDREKGSEYPFLRVRDRDGHHVDFGDDFTYGYDAAWAPDGDRMIEPGFYITGPLFTRPPGAPVGLSVLPDPLGISWPAVDPGWSRR